jgi:hypothetical protein
MAGYVVEAGREVKRFVETAQNNKGILYGMPLLVAFDLGKRKKN